MNNNYLFTSESVSEGHPDKICDQISDAIVDAYLDKSEQKDQVRVACETMVTTNRVILAGEIRGSEIKNEEIEVRINVMSHYERNERPIFRTTDLLLPRIRGR